jgi:hypothetical protein
MRLLKLSINQNSIIIYHKFNNNLKNYFSKYKNKSVRVRVELCVTFFLISKIEIYSKEHCGIEYRQEAIKRKIQLSIHLNI